MLEGVGDGFEVRLATRRGAYWKRDSTPFAPLYKGFYYSEHVVMRASTVAHEARHAEGWCQHQGNCKRGVSCDRSWTTGARVSEVLLERGRMRTRLFGTPGWQPPVGQSGFSDLIKSSAWTEATQLLEETFEKDPRWEMGKDGYLYATC